MAGVGGSGPPAGIGVELTLLCGDVVKRLAVGSQDSSYVGGHSFSEDTRSRSVFTLVLLHSFAFF